MNCPNCGQVNDEDAEFCENCGSPLSRACSSCGAPLKPKSRFCKKCGTPVAAIPQMDRLVNLQKNAPPELQEKMRLAARQVEGERKPVTILFTDIVGSTALAEKLDPEEWKEIVSGAHQRVSQAIYRYEGTIAQLLGDGVLTFFGAPVTHEDDPLRAVLAALDIQRAIAEYERQLQGYLEHFQMRIGLNTGTVVVGSVGSDLHMEYLAIGDAVNLAARLQSAAQPGKVLLSESTAKLVQAAFSLQSLGEITVKGKAEPVAVFEVLESKTSLTSQRGFEMLHSPLVGRETELATLQQAFTRLGSGLGQIVSIIGEAGIGKSRLVEETHYAAGLDQNLHWLEGRALSYGQKLSFWTIRQLLQNDLGLSDGDPEIKQRLALRKRTETLFGGDASQVLPYLANLLGVQLEGELAKRVNILDGETLKHQTLLSIQRYFTRLAEGQPTVLVFDDLHWADPSSLEVLEHLLPVTNQASLMLLMLSRMEREHPSWLIKLKAETEYAHRYTEIQLQPLPREEQDQLVDNLLAIADLPQIVRRRILERAEGNPLFLEEVIRHLIDHGAIVREAGTWRASADILDITIPETLRGVLLARIDRLQEDVRHTLQLAAVIGKSFLYRLLKAITEAEAELESHLAQLQRADLLREKARLPELEYIFKHSMTQEASYDSLLLTQRRVFHRQVGEALEALFADRQGEFIGLLAYHFDAAGETEKAVSYLIEAGDQARLTDEHTEAVGYYQRANELLREIGDEERSAHVWLKLGLVHHTNFRFEETYQAYEHAFQFAQKTKRLPYTAKPGKGSKLRMVGNLWDAIFDPGKAITVGDLIVQSWLFSGLAQVDDELNVIPDVARSWQVLDGGVRYLFHLRDDVRWTDGDLVTAHDFEWAWKRNLHPSIDRQSAQYLFDVVGAQAYHRGDIADPASIGIHALDDWNLEVKLIEPVAYFPYIFTLPASFPLPRTAIERYGDDWSKPEYIVSNGAYRLVEFTPGSGFAIERNPDYHGDFPGNIYEYEFKFARGPMDVLRAYQENEADISLSVGVQRDELPAGIPAEEQHHDHNLDVWFILINPMSPPFDDVRVRRALALSLDHERVLFKFGLPGAFGGIIPPGMPGHSPDILPRYNPGLARSLIAEAGFPDGQGLPVLKATAYPKNYGENFQEIMKSILQQWKVELGIRVDFDMSARSNINQYSLIFLGWIGDYPDPDNFLRKSTYTHFLQQLGWKDLEYDALVEKAAHLSDRSQRMAMYRKADHLVVVDQAVVLPWNYSTFGANLVKPWVKNYKQTLLGNFSIKNFIIEEH